VSPLLETTDSSDGFRDLIVRAQQGDRTAIDTLLDVIRPWLWQAARGFADPERPDESTADLAQAAWLRAWQSLGQFQGPGEGNTGDAQTLAMFRAWVLQIVRRLGMNNVRDRQTEHRRPPGRLRRLDAALPGSSTASWGDPHLEAAEPSPSAQAEANEQAVRIRAAFDRLADDEDRQIIHLRFSEGLSLRQIAARLGRNHEHIRRRFHAALRLLEHDLEDLR
jgi:RNA polymerase sigma factor (sigma-70 family)